MPRTLHMHTHAQSNSLSCSKSFNARSQHKKSRCKCLKVCLTAFGAAGPQRDMAANSHMECWCTSAGSKHSTSAHPCKPNMCKKVPVMSMPNCGVTRCVCRASNAIHTSQHLDSNGRPTGTRIDLSWAPRRQLVAHRAPFSNLKDVLRTSKNTESPWKNAKCLCHGPKDFETLPDQAQKLHAHMNRCQTHSDAMAFRGGGLGMECRAAMPLAESACTWAALKQPVGGQRCKACAFRCMQG